MGAPAQAVAAARRSKYEQGRAKGWRALWGALVQEVAAPRRLKEGDLSEQIFWICQMDHLLSCFKAMGITSFMFVWTFIVQRPVWALCVASNV